MAYATVKSGIRITDSAIERYKAAGLSESEAKSKASATVIMIEAKDKSVAQARTAIDGAVNELGNKLIAACDNPAFTKVEKDIIESAVERFSKQFDIVACWSAALSEAIKARAELPEAEKAKPAGSVTVEL